MMNVLPELAMYSHLRSQISSLAFVPEKLYEDVTTYRLPGKLVTESGLDTRGGGGGLKNEFCSLNLVKTETKYKI